jgi:hypothetical protein
MLELRDNSTSHAHDVNNFFKRLFDSISNLGINIENLSLTSNKDITDERKTDLTKKRFKYFYILSKILSPNEFNSFYCSLSEDQKTSIQDNDNYQITSNPLQSLNDPDLRSESQISSLFALKHPNLGSLIKNPEFRTDYSIFNIGSILLLQSILMHNPQGVDEIRGLSDLTPEQNNKRQQVLKKIAIASLVNENLHEKSLDILNGILPQQFTQEDKKTIQASIDFMSVKIEKSISENKNEQTVYQFNLLEKVLNFYADKFSTPEYNISLHLPENITKALEEKKKFEMGVVATQNKETLSPKEFGEISPRAPVLEKDNLQVISGQVILNTLKQRPSAIPAQGQVVGTATTIRDR